MNFLFFFPSILISVYLNLNWLCTLSFFLPLLIPSFQYLDPSSFFFSSPNCKIIPFLGGTRARESISLNIKDSGDFWLLIFMSRPWLAWVLQLSTMVFPHFSVEIEGLTTRVSAMDWCLFVVSLLKFHHRETWKQPSQMTFCRKVL